VADHTLCVYPFAAQVCDDGIDNLGLGALEFLLFALVTFFIFRGRAERVWRPVDDMGDIQMPIRNLGPFARIFNGPVTTLTAIGPHK